MEQAAAELKKIPTQTKAFKGLLKDIAGKKLADVKNEDPDVQAVQRGLWIRLYDEAHKGPTNDQYSPTGEVTGHSPESRSWIGLQHVGKAVKILENGSVENINDVMGQGHKIRNFYNNIINPNSKAGHVTVDTHATAAATLQPLGPDDIEAKHTFGGSSKGIPGAPKNDATGLQGTYPLYAEAYQRVARKLGIPTHELQSVVWEAAKSLFDNKTSNLKAEVRDIWQQVQDGKLTQAEARDKIKSASNGFSKPAWMSDEEWEKTGAEGEDTSFMGEGEGQEQRTGDIFYHGTSWNAADRIAKSGLDPKAFKAGHVSATTEPWAAREYAKGVTEDTTDKHAVVEFEHPYKATHPDPEHDLVEGEGDLYRRISSHVPASKVRTIRYYDGDKLVKTTGGNNG